MNCPFKKKSSYFFYKVLLKIFNVKLFYNSDKTLKNDHNNPSPTSSKASFQSFLIENDQFEDYTFDPLGLLEQALYPKKARSFSPRINPEKLPKRTKTPFKKFTKYIKGKDFNVLSEIFEKSKQKNKVNPFLPILAQNKKKNTKPGNFLQKYPNTFIYDNNNNVLGRLKVEIKDINSSKNKLQNTINPLRNIKEQKKTPKLYDFESIFTFKIMLNNQYIR